MYIQMYVYLNEGAPRYLQDNIERTSDASLFFQWVNLDPALARSRFFLGEYGTLPEHQQTHFPTNIHPLPTRFKVPPSNLEYSSG